MNKKEEKIFSILSMVAHPFILVLPKSIVRILLKVLSLGESKIVYGLRYILYRRIMGNIGKKVIFAPFLTFKSPEKINIGTNVSIHHNCYFEGVGGIDIGSNVMIAHQVSILSNSHITDSINMPIKEQGVRVNKVTIDDNVWIGAKVTILDGVKIGEGAVLAANSVVNKDVDKFTVVGGVPARLIKKRTDD